MSTDDILSRYGGLINNDLNSVLNHIEEDDPQELLAYSDTTYVEIESMLQHVKNIKLASKFPVLSINIQSLNAKYNKLFALVEYLSSKDCMFGAICVQ